MLGDRRYGDQVKDLSSSAYNDELARDREYLARLAMIDTAGLSEREKLLAGLLQEELFDAETGAKFKEWQLPVSRCGDLEAEMAADVAKFPFQTGKDYDDYIARLKKYPAELRQASSNMLAGIDQGRVPAVDVLLKAAKNTDEIAGQKPEESVFAEPLKRFPAGVGATDRKRISEALLKVIEDEVEPAYVRFGNFLKAREIPAAEKDAGAWQTREGDAYYAFCVQRAETRKKIEELER